MWPLSTGYPEVSCAELADTYDYIILGGGTAGCVLANRLSNIPGKTVLLVEKGHAADSWASRIPLFSTDFMSDGSRTYRRDSAAQLFLGNKAQELFSGKVLGGTSRINSMLYTRGIPAEFNAWSEAGRTGWSYDEVSPLFKLSEGTTSPDVGPDRGRNGEWKTRLMDKFYFAETNHIINAAEKLNLPFIGDMNASDSPACGCAQAQFTIDSKGHRNSTFHAFLPQELVSQRKNLVICTGTMTTKIEIQLGDGGKLRAVGANLQSASSRSKKAYVLARKEIILCCGPLGNPQTLMLSGIGERANLESVGIPVLKDLPGVGMHLVSYFLTLCDKEVADEVPQQDHFGVPIVYNVPMEDSLVSLEKRPLRFLKEFMRYMISGSGLLLSPVLELSLFAKSDKLSADSQLVSTKVDQDARNPKNIPDIEIMPIAYDATSKPFDKSMGKFSFLNVLLRPKSTGIVRLTSSDPNDSMQFDLGTLSNAEDWNVIRSALRLSISLSQKMRESGYPISEYRAPVSSSDPDLDAFIKEWGRTTYHYSSTCRMAPEYDSMPGVVDDHLRVYGIEGLRVADSSVFPQIPAAHLQAPAVMVAEKCAQLIFSDL